MVNSQDDNPDNNIFLVQLLEKLQVDVTVVRTSEEALDATRWVNYDLMISDVWRVEDPREPLNDCKVHYFEYPNENLRAEFGDSSEGLARFNELQNREGPAGFSLLEAMIRRGSAQAGDVPRFIFFTGRNADVVRSLCGEKVTDRADILLQSVVSLLSETRWEKLAAPLGSSNK